jgi:hypothetical protein
MPGNALRQGKEESHTHTHTSSIRITLPHLDPLPTARLPNTHLKQIDGSGTTGSHENRRNVKRYVHPCRCCTTTLFIKSPYPFTACIHTLPLHKPILHFLSLLVDNTILSVHLSLFTAACRRHQAGKPRSTQHLPPTNTNHFFLFCTFDSSPSDTLQHLTQTDTHSSAGRLLTLPTDSSTTIHRSTHNNSHQHAFSSRPRRSHHGAVRPTRFNSLSCLCCSHFSCSSSGIFILLDGDHRAQGHSLG